MSSGPSEQKSRDLRLDTWKSIAQYLGRSSRTVQRWHSDYGLPVHHLSGESGSVYAYSDDLDRWLRTRGRARFDSPSKYPGTKILPATTDSDGLNHHNSIFDSSLIPSQARIRSAQLVVFAGHKWKSVSDRNLTAILHHYREAIDLDPCNATAYAGLSMGLILQGVWGLVSPAVAYASAKAALGDAVKINSELPLAECASAWLNLFATRDWQGARRSFEELLELVPSCAHSMNGFGLFCIAEGWPQAASEIFLNAAEQNPLSASSMTLYCWSEYLAGDYAHALHRVNELRTTGRTGPVLNEVEALALIQQEDWETQLGRIEELAAESLQQHVVSGVLGHAYALKGQNQRAREILDRMTKGKKHSMSPEPYAIALILIGLNEKQRAVNCLEQSYRNGSLWSLGFGSDPNLNCLRNDPHYKQFLTRCSYPDPVRDDVYLRAAS